MNQRLGIVTVLFVLWCIIYPLLPGAAQDDDQAGKLATDTPWVRRDRIPMAVYEATTPTGKVGQLTVLFCQSPDGRWGSRPSKTFPVMFPTPEPKPDWKLTVWRMHVVGPAGPIPIVIPWWSKAP